MLQEGLLDKSWGTHVCSVAGAAGGLDAPHEVSAPLARVLCATLQLKLLSGDLLATNLFFKDRVFFGIAPPVPGRALLVVPIAAGVAGNPLG